MSKQYELPDCEHLVVSSFRNQDVILDSISAIAGAGAELALADVIVKETSYGVEF